jgi:hypothetical protein
METLLAVSGFWDRAAGLNVRDIPGSRGENKPIEWGGGDTEAVRNLRHGDVRIGEHRLEDGRVLSRKVESVPGDPLEAKFRGCVSFAAVSLAPKNIDAAMVLIDDVENVTDVAGIPRLLTPERAA